VLADIAVTATLDHVTIITDDFDTSRPIYDAVLGSFGMKHSVEYEDPEEEDDDPGTVAAVGYALDGHRTRFWLVAGLTPTTGAHMAFAVSARPAVDAAFAAACEAGAVAVQAPRAWEAEQLGYYGSQVADPFGNVIEVVFRPV
jgi:catechol 2,3-dioxygenase-like lactoylglutathione lyase family enzyme